MNEYTKDILSNEQIVNFQECATEYSFSFKGIEEITIFVKIFETKEKGLYSYKTSYNIKIPNTAEYRPSKLFFKNKDEALKNAIQRMLDQYKTALKQNFIPSPNWLVENNDYN